MKIVLFYIFIFLNCHLLMASEQLVFHIHGGAVRSYKSDKINIDPRGRVTLESVAKTFADYPNRIGQFEYELDSKQLSEKIKKIVRSEKEIKRSGYKSKKGAFSEDLYIGEEVTQWSSRDRHRSIEVIRSEFLSLARKAYKNPVMAMSLECSQDRTQITCSYINVGKKMIKTVDPLGVSSSVSCLNILGKKKVLHELKEYDPKAMTPQRIRIKPNEKYTFSVKTNHICDFRVIVKTTDMMINDKYKEVLLGELVSNVISK